MSQDTDQPTTSVNVENTGINTSPITTQSINNNVSDTGTSSVPKIPEGAPMSRPSSNFNDILPNQPVMKSKAPKNKMGINMKSKKTTIAFILILVALLATASMFLVFGKTDPTKAVKQATSSIVADKGAKSFVFSSSINDSARGTSTINGKSTSDGNGNYRIDIDRFTPNLNGTFVTGTDGKLKFTPAEKPLNIKASTSFLVRGAEKTIYMKSDNPNDLISYLNFTAPLSGGQASDLFKNKWVKLDPAILSTTNIPSGISPAVISSCVNSLSNYMKSSADKTSDLNKYVNTFSSEFLDKGKSTVDGVDSIMYTKTMDKNMSTSIIKDRIVQNNKAESIIVNSCSIPSSYNETVSLNGLSADEINVYLVKGNFYRLELKSTKSANKFSSEMNSTTVHLDTQVPKDIVNATDMAKDSNSMSLLVLLLMAQIKHNLTI
ncbi:MAG: hypothetical protein WCI60_05325 [bacterium]